MRTDVYKDIKLSERDIWELLYILKSHIEVKNEEIKQAEKDEKAGIPVAHFDTYVDFLAALQASKNQAKELLRSIQEQTGIQMLYELTIDRL
jgi:hypothetical protein